MFMSTAVDALATRDRLLAAATELFAERGFRGATLRDIAERAGANVAAANYHFGSKERLYREVCFAQFAALQRAFTERGLDPGDAELEALGREALAALLRSRIEFMLRTLIVPPAYQAALLMRELCDPSEVLPEIVERFIAPMREMMERIVRRIAPELGAGDARRCVEGIAGQFFFYRTHRPALLLLQGRASYPPGFESDLAREITEFSLGGIERIAARSRRKNP